MATLDRQREAGGLGVKLEQEGERVLVRLSGHLDLTSTDAFDAGLRRAVRWSDFGVVLDLSGVTFIDSAGLHALIGAWTLCLTSRRELVVLSASEQVRQMIELSGLEDLLPLGD